MKALLLGREPPRDLGYSYVTGGEYDGVVVGSLTLSALLGFDFAPALEALAEGKPVVVYEPGLPRSPGSRGLSAALASRKRELKNWGMVFTDGAQKKLITAQEARSLLAAGKRPGPGAVLTPLAREILGGSI